MHEAGRLRLHLRVIAGPRSGGAQIRHELAAHAAVERRGAQLVKVEGQQRFRRRAVLLRGRQQVELLVVRERRDEVHARQHRAGRKPRLARVPAAHVRRLVESLSHVRHRRDRVVDGEAAPPDVLQRTHDEFHRPRVAGIVRPAVPELRRQEHLAHDLAHVVAALQVHAGDPIDERGIGIAELADEEAPQLSREIAAGVRVRRQRVDQIDAVLHAGVGRPRRYGLVAVRIDRKAEGLRRRLVVCGAVEEFVTGAAVGHVARTLQVPAAEHARGGVHVRFRVVADAHREQFHDLAAEVLLRLRFRVRAAVEPHEHRRVLRDVQQDVAEVPERVVAQHLDLAADFRRILRRLRRHVARAFGGEVVVPEERHLLLERTVAVDHPEQPALT